MLDVVRTHPHTHCPPNTSALLPWRSLTELPLTTKMDAPPGTIPNLFHRLICFADLTTFEHNTEVSVCALKERKHQCFCVCVFVPKSDHSSRSPGVVKTPSWGLLTVGRELRGLPPISSPSNFKLQVMLSLMRCCTNMACCSFMHVSPQVP